MAYPILPQAYPVPGTMPAGDPAAAGTPVPADLPTRRGDTIYLTQMPGTNESYVAYRFTLKTKILAELMPARR